MNTTDIDEEVVQRLLDAINEPIKAHFLDGPPARDKVYEILNALAYTTACIIVGTRCDPNAFAFFSDAFNDALNDLHEEETKQ